MRSILHAARSAVLAGVLGVVGACAQHTIVPARGPITFNGLTFPPPPGDGWMQLERSGEHVVFGRRAPEDGTRDHKGESSPVDLTAWVKIVRTPQPVTSYAALHTIIVRMTDQIDHHRFELHRHVVEPLDTPAAMCVRRTMLLDDLRTPGAFGTPRAMRMVDTLCRDPAQHDSIYAIHISERAARLRPLDISGHVSDQWLATMRFRATANHSP